MRSLQKIEVSVFKMSDGSPMRQEWNGLHEGIRKAFNEVLYTSAVCKKGNSSGRKCEECFVFGYADLEIEFSAMCMVKNNKAAFYFNEVA